MPPLRVLTPLSWAPQDVDATVAIEVAGAGDVPVGAGIGIGVGEVPAKAAVGLAQPIGRQPRGPKALCGSRALVFRDVRSPSDRNRLGIGGMGDVPSQYQGLRPRGLMSAMGRKTTLR
jgi:hypothetical protein